MNQTQQLRNEINQVKTDNRDLVAEKDKLNEDFYMKSSQEANSDFEMDQTILDWKLNESMWGFFFHLLCHFLLYLNFPKTMKT